MTRLLEPNLGEVLDRLTILELKVKFGMRSGKSTQDFEQEVLALEAYMNKKLTNVTKTLPSGAWDAFLQYKAELAQVNERLWRSENELRALKADGAGSCIDGLPVGGHAENVAAVAFRIADLNDVRAKLMQQINAIFGAPGEEKLYDVHRAGA